MLVLVTMIRTVGQGFEHAHKDEQAYRHLVQCRPRRAIVRVHYIHGYDEPQTDGGLRALLPVLWRNYRRDGKTDDQRAGNNRVGRGEGIKRVVARQPEWRCKQ